MSRSECPSLNALREFDAGSLNGDVVEQLVVHLDECAACLKTLDKIGAETNLELAVTRPRQFVFAQEAQYQELERRVCGDCNIDVDILKAHTNCRKSIMASSDTRSLSP